MKKIKLFPTKHVEIRIHVSEEMERDYKKCRAEGTGFRCENCSWYDVRPYDLPLCSDNDVRRQMEELS